MSNEPTPVISNLTTFTAPSFCCHSFNASNKWWALVYGSCLGRRAEIDYLCNFLAGTGMRTVNRVLEVLERKHVVFTGVQLPKPMSQRRSGYARLASDQYETPQWVTLALCPHIPQSVVWEPAAGSGKVADALISAGLHVVQSDIQTGEDFLRIQTCPEGAGAIITNPPYGWQKNSSRMGWLWRTSWRCSCGQILTMPEGDNIYLEDVRSSQRSSCSPDELSGSKTRKARRHLITRGLSGIASTAASPILIYVYASGAIRCELHGTANSCREC
jgi:hypothetical protein